MKVDIAWVHRVAKLARLQVSDERAGRLARELGSVIEYVDALGTIDLSTATNAEPLVSPVRREDVVIAPLDEPLTAHASELAGDEVTIHAAVETES